METVRELLIAIGLDVKQAEWVEALGLEKLLEKGAELAVEALKAIPEFVNEAVESTAKFAKQLQGMSARTGESTDSLQKLGYIAGLSGIDMGEVEVSLTHLSRAMNEARNGSVDAQSAFAKLGTRVTDGNGKLRSYGDVLVDLSDGFKKLPAGPERSAVALQVLGRTGNKFAGVLSKDLRALGVEFDDLGLNMDQESIQKGAELEHGMERLDAVFAALRRELVGPVIAALVPVVEEFTEWVKQNRELISTISHGLGRVLALVFGRGMIGKLLLFGKALTYVTDHLRFFAMLLGGIVLGALYANATALGELAIWYGIVAFEAVTSAAVVAMAWVAANWPIIAIIAALGVLLLVIDDVWGYFHGEDSLIGELGDKWVAFLNKFTRSVSSDPWWLTALKTALKYMTDITSLFDGSRFFDYLAQKFGPEVHAGNMGNPGVAQPQIFAGGASGPSAAAQEKAQQPWLSNDFQVEMNVTAAPGMSPTDVANQAVSAMDEWHAQKLREAMAAQ